MFLKYIFLLCLTYYTPPVNSWNPMEILILWDTIRGDNNYIYYDDLYRYFYEENPKKVSRVLQLFGHKYSPENKSEHEHRMSLDEFSNAMNKGHIPICSEQAVKTVFKEITSKHEGRNYIILKNMIEYYGSTVPEGKLIHVINTYRRGITIDLQYKLKFPQFRKAINAGDLPKPLHDAISIEKEMEKLFDEIRNIEKDYVTKKDMRYFYDTNNDLKELEKVVNIYGSLNYPTDVMAGVEEWRMSYSKFLEAGSNGDVPRFSEKLIKTAFMEIIPEAEDREYFTDKEILDHYKTRIPKFQLANIMDKYGKIIDGKFGLDFYSFKKAMNSGRLPDPLSNKIDLIHSIFRIIIPENENRNYILHKDLLNFCGTRLNELRLIRIFEKYGKRHLNSEIDQSDFNLTWSSGLQYLLYFPDFKRAIGFGDLNKEITI